MKSMILKIIIFTFILGSNLVFSDTWKATLSAVDHSLGRVDHSQGQALHGWCPHRSQHLSVG